MSKRHVIFIHGFLENASMWKHITSKLSKKSLGIHTPELAGHGTRPQLIGQPSILDFAKDILLQIERNEDEKVIVIGHSMGGYVALEVCKLLGKEVSALCLLHSTARADDEEKKLARQRAVEAVQHNQSLYSRTMIASLFAESKKNQLRDSIERNIADANAMELKAITSSLMAMRNRPDNIDLLQQRSFPLYYFLGEEDARIPLSEMKEELQQLQGAVAEIAQSTGHMGHLECPQQVINFIQRIMRADM